MEEKKQEKSRIHKETVIIMSNTLVIFGVPVVIAFFLGRYLDATYAIRPYGSIGCLLFSFIFSWIVVIFYVIRFSKKAKEELNKEQGTKSKEQ